MKRFLNLHFMIALHLIVIAVLVTGSSWFIYASQTNMRTQLEENINRQTNLLGEIATITDRNGADEATAAIITDCPRRTEFEFLLVKLGTLGRKELIEVQQLFESCGSFYAERKALMVSRFTREYEVLRDNILLLATLDSDMSTDTLLQDWENLIRLEGQRSSLLTEQTVLQRDIISVLLAGNKVTSKEIAGTVLLAQELGDSLGVLDKQIDEARSKLVK